MKPYVQHSIASHYKICLVNNFGLDDFGSIPSILAYQKIFALVQAFVTSKYRNSQEYYSNVSIKFLGGELKNN